ncbi:S8 family serine peptidase [Bacillus sp. 31A1R]|uniref:S8 family serine peptidase n=1 Tax=Robertmurraya mangrovi TaxID=3098077 RepID=A0ABU5IXN6_9BACI|nr:S8 family serine peptidase [Bacillus sp. 31A1R]MDZ5471920.1 S8 family serine peptidase [Bacillus sp. 31A1R]
MNQSIETDQILIRFKENPDKNTLSNYEVVDSSLNKDEKVVAVKVSSKDINEHVQELNKKGNIINAEPDYIVKRSYLPNDPHISKQWHHNILGSSVAWEKTMGMKEVIVAVIDDGIELNHSDLKDQIVFPYDVITQSRSEINQGKHGTHVAGIIAASINNQFGGSGVAPKTKIMPINVFNGEYAYTSDIIKGIHYALENGAKIINLSLGMPSYSKELEEAIQNAYQKGLVIIAAAGNESNSQFYYPAAYKEVISVSATNEQDQFASFSNFGSHIDVSAPGYNILSTLPNNQLGYMSGTSMASPMVAGAAALIWALEPHLTNLDVAKRIITAVDDLGTPGKDLYYGYGRINLEKALTLRLLRQPIVDSVSDQDIVVKGKLLDNIEEGNILVQTEIGKVYSGIANGGVFQVRLPKQSSNSKLSIIVRDHIGNVSEPTIITVLDKTPPPLSKVNEVNDKLAYVTGKSEVGATISIETANGIYYGAVKEDGTYKVKIPLQKAGTRLIVSAKDGAGNSSKLIEVIVADRTAPSKPKLTKISNKDTLIMGKAEPGSMVVIKRGKVIVGKSFSNKSGKFEIKIKKQIAGTKLSITVKDLSNNESSPLIITVIDKIPPTKPKVYSVKSTSLVVKGKTEPFAKISILLGGEKIGIGKANSKGDFTVKIKKQIKGSSLKVIASDSRNNKSYSTIQVKE